MIILLISHRGGKNKMKNRYEIQYGASIHNSSQGTPIVTSPIFEYPNTISKGDTIKLLSYNWANEREKVYHDLGMEYIALAVEHVSHDIKRKCTVLDVREEASSEEDLKGLYKKVEEAFAKLNI